MSTTAKTQRLELVLRQIESLPTLPVIATKLLSLTTSDQSHAREVVELVSADQALTARVLAMCRHADLGLRDDVMTIQRAVVLLGFNAIRNAVLSIKVFETFSNAKPSKGGEASPDGSPLDRAAFWRHSLCVGIVAENIARLSRRKELQPSEAFVCGLLHDMGKLALDHLLPKSFARVVELTDLNQGNIAELEKRIIGLDHHTAGKRLAEQWQLPHRLADCIWLHGSAWETLPRVEHRPMIGLITLADAVARQHHLGYSGNYTFKESPAELAKSLGLDPQILRDACVNLHEELGQKSAALGLDAKPSSELYLDSIQQANQELGRLNNMLARRSQAAGMQGKMLEAISGFHADARPGRGVVDVLGSVARNFVSTFGQGFGAIIYPQGSSGDQGPQWLISQYDSTGMLEHSQYIDAPPGAPDIASFDAGAPGAIHLAGIVPWVADFLVGAPDVRQVKMLPLGCSWGTAAILLHDRADLPPWQQTGALIATWGSTIAAAAQHEGARRLGEELAQANRDLAAAQARITQNESMARLGEMAAGAAHEMNNPLAVIAGRSQLLAMTLPSGTKESKAAKTISDQAHRLSDLITSLRMFAEPPKAAKKPTDVGQMLQEVVRHVRLDFRDMPAGCEIYLQMKSSIPSVMIDSQQISQAVMELMHNAIQSVPRHMVQLTCAITPDDELMIQVADDGVGMDAHTLAHALDPFFSAKPAGRRAGMGLPRAQQLVQAHGGRIELRSSHPRGSVVTLFIPIEQSPSCEPALNR